MNEEGDPIDGAHIWLSPRAPGSEDITDSEGRFLLSGIFEERDSVYPVIEHPGYVPLDGFGQDLEKEGTTEVTYTMKRAAIVAGRVTAKADGRPLTGIRVVTGHDRFASNVAVPEAFTDSEGRYRLTSVKPGQALVHAFSEDFAPVMKTESTAAGEETEVNFESEPGQDVTGRVTDPDGKPIHDVWLITDTWHGARMFRREDHTDENGNYVLRNMPDTPAEVHVLKQGYVSKRDLMVVGGEKYDVVLQPETTHKVSVRLADTDDLPKEVEIHQGFKWPGRDSISWDRRTSLMRDWDAGTGTLTVTMDEPTSAEMFYRFRVPGYQDEVAAIPQDATEPKTLQVVLEQSVVVRGRVVSAESGQPMEGVTVAVVNSDDRLRMDHYVYFKDGWNALRDFPGLEATTKADGMFELPDLASCPGSDLVLMRPEAGFYVIRGATSALVDGCLELPFPAPSVVRGRIIDADKPVSGERVAISWQPLGVKEWDFPFGCGGQVTTDEAGRFEFHGLGPGQYRLSRVRAFDSPTGGGISMYMKWDELLVLPGQEINHDLIRPAGYTLQGRTVDREGEPVGNCIVTLAEAGERHIRLDAVRSDGVGNFSFLHVAPGEYSVEAEHYAEKATATCGLGDVDFSSRRTVAIDGDTSVEMKLAPQGTSGLARGRSLVGAIPPDFAAKLFDREESFTLSEQLGKVVAIDFWAEWCGPCMAAMPELKKVWEKYKDGDEVMLITVNLDQDAGRLRELLREKGLEFPVIFSGDGWSDKIALNFGIQSIPSSFVIGRDGRFASEKIHGAQLAKAIEDALAKPMDPAFAKGAKPARLEIEVRLEEDDSGVPGTELELQAQNADGSIVKEEKLPMPGQATKITWLYPRVGPGGLVRVAVFAPGLETQHRELRDPRISDSLSFQFRSPRTIRGRLTADEGKTPAEGLGVRATGGAGLVRSATTDSDGRFAIAAMPGSYRLSVFGDERFAPLDDIVRVEVPEDQDPPEEEIEVSRAVTIHGRVVDERGQPVQGAMVGSVSRRGEGTSDEEGRFTLPGVASTGTAQVGAATGEVFGLLEIDSPSSEVEYTIVIQYRPGSGRADEHLAAGAKVSSITAMILPSRERIVWRPEGSQETLVVFCALWHPQGRRLLNQAIKLCEQENIQLAAFSLDWSPDQGSRHLKDLHESRQIMYAGPGGLEVAETWKHDGVAQAYLVSAEGRVLESPLPGRLP